MKLDMNKRIQIRMTKKQMIMEMIEGLKYVSNEQVIKNCCKSTKARIEEVYNYYLNSNKTKEDKVFCIKLLIVW